MLTELHIEHLGVIERCDLVFGDGLSALTGETGAGKTMLVEAIELLVGGRADAALVRHGATEARVEGRFVSGDDEVILGRVIPAEGRSRAYVDGRPATVTTLAEMGAHLVDLHGQHAHQGLLTAAAQRAALDRFAGSDLDALAAARARRAEVDAALAAIGGDERTRAREIDLLRFQADEIDAAAIEDPDEEATLEAHEELLASAQSHREAALGAVATLEKEDGADDAVRSALAALAGRSPFTAVTDRLRAVAVEIADVAADLRHLGESIDEDPQRLAEVRARRQRLREVRRKYGETLTEVCAYREEVRARLDELSGYEERAAQLAAERERADHAVGEAAASVASARKGAAADLGAAVTEHLHALAMPAAQLEVDVAGEDPGDDVTFLLAANPGEPALPLAKVASGGELARTMLALRLVLTEAPDTLVFDEVDAGIGGAAATAVGAALADLGIRHQVLVVTHLAQVAALASTQFVVSKSTRAGRTTASAEPVDGPARTAEVARMLSGSAGGAAAQRHAEELLADGELRRGAAPAGRRVRR